MDPLTKLALGTTSKVLREIANAIDRVDPDAEPDSPPFVVHVAQLTINEAPARTMFRRNPKE